MTRFATRTSRRLSNLPPEPVPEIVRTKRQTTVPQIVLSDDSDEEILGNKKEVVPRTPRKEKSRISDNDLHEISPVTPPKQRRNNKNVLSEANEPQTPSSLFKKLALKSPKHENKCGKENHHSPTKEEKHKRKSLFNETIEPNVYQNARKALHSTVPTKMPGREKEHEELRNFIRGHLKSKTSGSLYVSGPPGTGKTASLNLILEENDIASEFKEVYVNCTAIKSCSAIYARITKELGIKTSGKTEKDNLAAIENYLKKNHKMTLLVLDEIDQLENKNQSILYTIFEWPSRPESKLILIGIANALDLTDRTLPRLQARCELKPKLMHFAPYTKQQIVDIFTSRLKEAGVLNVFSPIALQMLAGKVAAVSGDVRRALDIGRRVIELIDNNRNDEVLQPLENLAHELIDNENKKANDEKPKTVELKQVVNVLNNVYGTAQNMTDDQDETFPLQQKIIVCSLLLILKKARNKDVTIGKLHEVYRRVCTKRNLLSVDQAEFVGLCHLIETRGILRVTGKKEPRLHKVNLEWDEDEVANALRDKQLMSSILQDDSCLGKL